MVRKAQRWMVTVSACCLTFYIGTLFRADQQGQAVSVQRPSVQQGQAISVQRPSVQQGQAISVQRPSVQRNTPDKRDSHDGLHPASSGKKHGGDKAPPPASQRFLFQAQARAMGMGGYAVPRDTLAQQTNQSKGQGLFYTHDDWPQFPRKMFAGPIPKTPYDPPFAIQWEFDTSAFLQRPDVKGKPPKLITWMLKPKYVPNIPDPVRLRTCPEMPCRMSTNRDLAPESAALVWNGQYMTEERPPKHAHPDQVFVFNNQERQDPFIFRTSSFKKPAWASVFNWTMSYRFDADIVQLYGFLSHRPTPVVKDYAAIMAKKTKMAAWMVSHCKTHGQREKYIELLGKHIPVDMFGACSPRKCARNADDSCLDRVVREYKFFLAFENSLCVDYVTEKLFRYMEADVVVVVRGGPGYEKHAPSGTFINAADFKSTEELADYLKYLDSHPEEYIKILKAKDQVYPLYEEYPHRNSSGNIPYVHYQYEAVAFCEMCRRLWDVDAYRQTIPSINQWFNRGNCMEPQDLL